MKSGRAATYQKEKGRNCFSAKMWDNSISLTSVTQCDLWFPLYTLYTRNDYFKFSKITIILENILSLY